MGPADEAEGPDIASETSTLSPPVAPEEEEEDEDEEPASDFLLESIMEDVGGLSWSQEVQRVNKRQQTEMTEITQMQMLNRTFLKCKNTDACNDLDIHIWKKKTIYFLYILKQLSCFFLLLKVKPEN